MAEREVQRTRQRLQLALRHALKARDEVAVAALRSALSAIDNAESVAAAPQRDSGGSDIAGARLGVGAAEVKRRELSAGDVAAILRSEVEERISAAGEYERLGKLEPAARLRAEAAVLERHAGGAA